MLHKVDSGSYGSVSAFVHAALTECVNPKNKSVRDDFTTSENRGSWYGAGCKTGAEVRQKLASGWIEGRKRVQELTSKLDVSKLAPRDMRRRLSRGDMGDTLDIGAVYAGRFQTAWSRATRQNTAGPQRVDVLANMVCSGMEDSEVLFWRGAAAIALADKLESAGYMVRIVVGFGDGKNESGKWRGNTSCRITVKDHDKPMDVTTAASVIMPGFFRAIGHGWIAGHDSEERYSPGIMPAECRQEKGELFLSHSVRDSSSALRWLQTQIDAINAKA